MENSNHEKPSHIETMLNIEKSARKVCFGLLAFVGFVTVCQTLIQEYDDAVDRNPTTQEWDDPEFQDCFADRQKLFELVVSDQVANMEAEDVCLTEVYPKPK